jgi:hypothetical protein
MQGAGMMAQSSLTKALTPDFAGLQYAGSIGYISAGAGYTLFKKTNMNINYGYVSEKKGGQMHILALKFEYKPFRIPLSENVVLQPINPGVFLSYTFAKELSYRFESPQYPKNYYFWSEALRKHISANSEIKFINPLKNGKVQALSVYIEANTNDIYMISWFENRTTIPFTDIFKLGYGLRVYF